MDFFEVIKKHNRATGEDVLIPRFKVVKSTDLMIRGGAFYAIWDESTGLWTQDEYFVVKVVDEVLAKASKETGLRYLSLADYDSGNWSTFKRYMREIGNNSVPLNSNIVFANQKTKKTDYASFKLDYDLVKGPCAAWDELVGTLYSEEEKAKIEWAIGAVLSGDSKRLQKFLVFYGPPASGKSTVLNILEDMFDGYAVTFDAKALGSSNGGFSTGPFASNPLVGIQQDGDLSKIEDNTKINSIVGHDVVLINEKYMKPFSLKLDTFLILGTNQPVKITDAKSGIIRRLIDVQPTGKRIDPEHYFNLLNRIKYEHGAIANKCLNKYRKMGFHYYDGYKAFEMMLQTDVFLNYVEYYFDVFKKEDGITLKHAYGLYKTFCEETGIRFVMPQYRFREELKNYFKEFKERVQIDGVEYRSYYEGFQFKPSAKINLVNDKVYTIDLIDVQPGVHSSIFDEDCANQPAQYAKDDTGFPYRKWEGVKTKLSAIDTTRLHWVKVPQNHIVIDFDLTDETGEKSLERNIEEALKWPPTYCELSKSGKALHLHYVYEGDDIADIDSKYADGIEIKTLLGDQALRRKLTKCNNHVVSVISGNLPKKERKMINVKEVRTEKSLRTLIDRNIQKEIHPATKPSVEFILKILEDAYESDLIYDVRDMRAKVLTFAAKSTHHADECIKMVLRMPFQSKVRPEEVFGDKDESTIVFFDVEVYSNLFVVCWKYNKPGAEVVRMINPTPGEIAQLMNMKLVGFNNRRYDNHILYARFLGYSNEGLYHLSQQIIGRGERVLFGEAYNVSYTDVFDFSSKKQSQKKFQIELGLNHMEMDIPWDQPVKPEDVDRVVEYCVNDVVTLEQTFHARKQDFVARQILAELSGLSVNHTTQNHTARIIFGDDKRPQDKFVYTDLSVQFPGYTYNGKDSSYRGEVTGEGGYVYAEPGQYENVAVLDVASMHPTSIELLNLFGPYTSRFSALKDARVAIKRKEYEKARHLLEGRLQPFLVSAEDNPTDAEALSYALKIVINIVYGLTSASFDNPFRDKRNKDNIVAKRGALFMIDLKHAVQEQGFQVVHIKTDSIKIPNATPEIIQFVKDFGAKYGYDFEHETTYDKFCLVNNAVYIAMEVIPATLEGPNDDAWKRKWTAVGAQFQHPYVFKKLFTGEPLEFKDFCETKSVVQGAMYLDFRDSDNIDDYVFIGGVGQFVPVQTGGATLWRVKDGNRFAVTGTKGFRWITSAVAAQRELEGTLDIDMDYFKKLQLQAIESINAVGNYEELIK